MEKLFEAVKNNRFSWILASGQIYEKADVNEKDSKGNTPIYYAAKAGSYDFCHFLIGLGANVNEICSNGDTPMHMACASNNYDVIMFFIQSKASFNNVNNDGFTPLAFLNETMMKKLDLTEGIVSLTKKEKNINNDGLLMKTTKNKEMGEVFLMTGFGKMVNHAKDHEGGKGKWVSSFRSENWETQMESIEEPGSQVKNKMKKISWEEKII